MRVGQHGRGAKTALIPGADLTALPCIGAASPASSTARRGYRLGTRDCTSGAGIDPNTAYYRVLEEWAPAGGVPDVAYTYADALLKQSVGPTFYHGDAIGSTRLLTDATQTPNNTYAYEAFGSLLSSTGTTPNKYRFTRAESTLPGAYNLRARYYDPVTAAFLSSDVAPDSPGDPLGINDYVYAKDNPVRLVDPSGMGADPENELLGYLVEAEVCALYTAEHPSFKVSCSGPKHFNYNRVAHREDDGSVERAPYDPDILNHLWNEERGGLYWSGTGLWLEVKKYNENGVASAFEAFAKYALGYADFNYWPDTFWPLKDRVLPIVGHPTVKEVMIFQDKPQGIVYYTEFFKRDPVTQEAVDWVHLGAPMPEWRRYAPAYVTASGSVIALRLMVPKVMAMRQAQATLSVSVGALGY